MFQTNLFNNIEFAKLKDLPLSSNIITNINIDSELNDKSENPVQNKVITETIDNINEDIEHLNEEINNIKDNNIDININIDTELDESSENPVQNKVITETIDNINKNIDDLTTNKLDLSAYSVDSSLNEISENPVQNKAIRNIIYNIMDRVSQLEYVNNIKLSYATNLEVFATKNTIQAGTQSLLSANIPRMFANTNKWEKNKSYTKDAVITDYTTGNDNSSEESLLLQPVGIYKAVQDVPANTAELSDTTYWENLTDTYLYVDKDDNDNIKNYYHKFIEDVPAGTVQTLILKSETGPTEQNVIIDWGDGNKTNLRAAVDGNTDELSYETDENGFVYTCKHDYNTSLTNSGETEKYYTIEIVGNKFSILTSKEDENIISNVFGNNMQFYLNCIDVEGLLKGSKKILYVSCADYNSAITSIRNAKSLFENCTNLQYAIGFYELTGINTMLSMQRMFAGCKNMLNCDCRIAKSIAAKDDNGNTEVYLDCENMSSRLRMLLPTNGFDSPIVTLNSTFKNCKSIYIYTSSETGEPTDTNHINAILFNDTTKTFYHDGTFYGCDLINSIDGFIPDDWK